MPIQKCQNNGRSGYRWGSTGKCYIGPGAKKAAVRQGLAVEGPEKFKEIMSANIDDSLDDINEHLILADLLTTTSQRYIAFMNSKGDVFEKCGAYIPAADRQKMPLSDFGWPGERKFPIRNQEELDAAAKLIGRAPTEKQASIKRRIIEIAKRKGLKLPESWQ